MCPLQGKCLLENIVYQATITPEPNNQNMKTETYIGLTSNKFKTRLANHKASQKNRDLEASCRLARFCWKLKDKKIDYDIKWKIITKASPFSPITRVCNLCVNEKLHIMYHPNEGTLNSKSELTTNCRHRTKCLLDKG